MRNSSISFHIYLALWCVYWLQSIFSEAGEYLSKNILMFLLIVSLYFFITSIFQYKLPSVMRVLSLMVCIFTLYGIISIILGETFYVGENDISEITSMDYIKNVLISFLPVYTTYVATKKGQLTEESLRVWTFFFLAVAIVNFYWIQMSHLNYFGQSEITNNSAYSVLAIMVLLPLFNNKPLLQYVIFASCMFYVLIGMKRGALLCGTTAAIWFVFNAIRTQRRYKRGIRTILLTITIVFAAFYLVNFMLESSNYFNMRLESTLAGESSTRDEIYALLFSHFINETSWSHFLFGNGANATLNIAMTYAHNDWLEIATNNGLVMIFIYFIYWIKMFNIIRHSKKNNKVFMMLSLFFIIYLLKSFFSMSYGSIPICASVAFGYALARYTEQDAQRNIQKRIA